MTNIGNIWGHIPKSLEEVFHRAEGFLEEEQYERLADYVTRPEHLIVQMHTLLSRSMAITSGQRQALEYLLMFVDSKSQGNNRLAKKPDALCYFMSIFHNGFDGMPLELIACLHEKAKEDGCHLLTRLVERIKVRNISITLSDAYSEEIGFRSRKELLDKRLMKAIAHFVPKFEKYFDTTTDTELLSDGAEESKNEEPMIVVKPTYKTLAFKDISNWTAEDFKFTRAPYSMWTNKKELEVYADVLEFFGLDQTQYVEYHKKKMELLLEKDDSARREAYVKLSEMEWIVNWTSIQDRLEEDADFVIDPGKMKQKRDTTGLTGIDAVEYKYIAVHLYVIKQKLLEEWKFDRCLYESNDDSSKPVETTSLMVKERSNEKEAKNLQEIQVRWDKSQALVVERGVQYSNVTMARAMQQKQIDTGKFIILNSPAFLAIHRTFYELRKKATGDQNALTVGSISDVSYCQTSSAYVEAIAMHGLGLSLWAGEDLVDISENTPKVITDTKSKPTLKKTHEKWNDVVNFVKANKNEPFASTISKVEQKFTLSVAIKKDLSNYAK